MRKLLFILLTFMAIPGICQTSQRPNVILIITDDQGYGDLGYHGNPIVQTPNLDQLAEASVRLNNFYVSPVCAPTRSSLMTGRYSLRTGVHDTYNGGAIMSTEEITIAEVLKEAGYKTGAFGKWHLGDNYPSRPGDQGFDESVIHQAGGMGQPGDFTTYFKFDSSYFDPVLWHNDQQESYKGYCSDIFTGEAIKFIEQNKEGPFFCYLAFNAPHTPLQVPDKYYQMYKDVDPAQGFDGDDRPFPEMLDKDREDARKVYAMVTNIDDNVGKMLQKLKGMGIEDNTVVIFMTDNGPQQRRYIAGMRGRKGSVYRGGVRVPFFIHSPGKFKGDRKINTTAAHIDILPTIASICEAPLPKGVKIDGKDLLPVLRGQAVDWENRSMFFYWTRKYPELYNNIALHKGSYKLVGHTSFDAEVRSGFKYIQFADVPEAYSSLVDAYLEGLTPVTSPYTSSSMDLEKGEALYQSLKCNDCHPGPLYTDLNSYILGEDKSLQWDTPTLVELWRTGPYWHDGRFAALEEIFEKEMHGLQESLSSDDIRTLIAYLLTL